MTEKREGCNSVVCLNVMVSNPNPNPPNPNPISSPPGGCVVLWDPSSGDGGGHHIFRRDDLYMRVAIVEWDWLILPTSLVHSKT